jgi:Protein of unknown function (DUF3431)
MMWVLLLSALCIGILLLFLFRRNYDNIVIVSSHYNEDLEWLKKSPWKVVICDKPGASLSSFRSDPSCTLDVNRGREASSFLKYIVENYDNLPPKMAFIHGHEHSEHQKYPKGLLEAIEDAKSDEFDYISLNNLIQIKKDSGTSPELPRHQHMKLEDHPKVYEEMRKTWSSVFEPILGVKIPEYFRFKGQAQFIVSKKAIHRHGKDVYRKFYDFMMDPNGDDWARGVIMEFVWHMIFTDSGHDICNDPSDPILYQNCTDEAYRSSRFNF